MPCRSDVVADATYSSGAFDIDCNLATAAGYASVGSGVLLATAVGTMVAPVPTLGLATLGGGLIVAGNFKDIKDYFVAPPAPVMSGDYHHTAGTDVTDGGQYQSVADAGKSVGQVVNAAGDAVAIEGL